MRALRGESEAGKSCCEDWLNGEGDDGCSVTGVLQS